MGRSVRQHRHESGLAPSEAGSPKLEFVYSFRDDLDEDTDTAAEEVYRAIERSHLGLQPVL